MEIPSIVLAWFFLVLSVGLFIFAVIADRIVKNDKKAKPKSLDGDSYGIFVEHGMVKRSNQRGVEGDQKFSDYYLDSISES